MASRRFERMMEIGIKTKERKHDMKKTFRKLINSKKLNHYCVDVLKMYNYGRVNIAV